jgi:pimeloyl-ACP methyl ester carboxylesterase
MVEQPDIPPAALAALQVPTLVIAGTRDMIAESHTRLIHRSIPGSRLALVEGDHFIAAKQSGLFNKAVERFLDRLPQEV